MLTLILSLAGFLLIGGAMTIPSLFVTKGSLRILLWGFLPILIIGAVVMFHLSTLQSGEYAGLGYVILGIGLISYCLALAAGLVLARVSSVRRLPWPIKSLVGVLLVGVAPLIVVGLGDPVAELVELLLGNSEAT